MNKSRPVGVPLLFDVPFTAGPARLDNSELGISKVVALVGRDASFAAEVTLLDVADHRLIRSGIELAHRVIDGRGDWYLRAPVWQPLLPVERIEPFAHGDLPEDFTELVMPFRRRGALGPVAAVSVERQTFAFRGETTEEPLGRLQDDRVTIRRGGVTTARFREVTIDPCSGLTDPQLTWLSSSLVAIGGTEVTGFPLLASRLGTPATGLTDFPEPRPLNQASSFETFVEAVLAGRLRELIAADLAGRAEEPGSAALLRTVAAGLRGELNGLSAALDPDWLAELDEELGWLISSIENANEAGQLRSVLRRERYLRLLDLLVIAARGPQVDEDAADLPAAETLTGLLSDAADKLIKDARRLGSGSEAEEWAAVALTAEEVGRIDGLARMVVAKRDRRTARRLRPAIDRLIEARTESDLAEQAQQQARFATPSDAFELGRSYQRHRQRQAAARDGFFDAWHRIAPKAGKPSR
jgi:hypothetical protein